jgi:choline dehydrogenase-like flavoprotein
MVHTVEVDKRGRASGVLYFDASGNEQRAAGRTVVLSCSAIETVRLLLNSKSALFPEGLGNHNGMVGKNAIFSHNAGASAGYERSNPESTPAWVFDRAPFVHRCVQDFYKRAAPECPTGGTLSFLPRPPNPIQSGLREAHAGGRLTIGIGLKERLRRELRESFRLGFEVFGEFLPNPETYIGVDPDVRDKWGIPVARIRMQPHPLDRVAAMALQEKGVQILKALGASEVDTLNELSPMMLQHGGCRFGTNPDTSVLNADCRSHGVPNLWVVDGSFTPTFGGVPPTWTIMANSFRVGESMARAFRRREVPG